MSNETPLKNATLGHLQDLAEAATGKEAPETKNECVEILAALGSDTFGMFVSYPDGKDSSRTAVISTYAYCLKTGEVFAKCVG